MTSGVRSLESGRLTCAAGLLLLAACSGGTGTADLPGGDVPDVPSLPADLPPGDAPGETFPIPAAGHCETNVDPLPDPFVPDVAATLPFLHVEGTRLVDADGNDVALRGVNLGSWLQVEAWIPGIGLQGEGEILADLEAQADALGLGDLYREAAGQNAAEWALELKSHWRCLQERRAWMYQQTDTDQQELVDALWGWFDGQPWIEAEEGLWNWLTRRFGEAGADQLRRVFRDRWITEEDVRRVAGLGLNLVRVPVWYRALETDRPGASAFDPDGWKRLDDLVTWARKHRVYVMIDLHGAPGGQSTAEHQGLQDGGALWTEPACIAKAARVWKAIASRYRDEPHVAVYDLLNEPMSFTGPEPYRTVHDALYRAIREVDPRHVVMIEDGYKSPQMVVSPKEMGWENAMFSIHRYDHEPDDAAAFAASLDAEIGKMEARWQWSTRFACPLFLGEFNAAAITGSGPWQADAMDRALDGLNRRGVHWAPWTWKFVWGGDTWGVLNPTGDADGRHVDVRDGSFEEIRAAFEALDTADWEAHPGYSAALRQRASEAFAPLDLGGE